MGSRLTFKHWPSNGLKLFSGTSAGVGVALMTHPEFARAHDAFDYLDCVNLMGAGSLVTLLALVQFVSDALVQPVARAVASCGLVFVYASLAIGVWSTDPALSGLMYTSYAIANALLAARKI